jgi:hypothetical protein
VDVSNVLSLLDFAYVVEMNVICGPARLMGKDDYENGSARFIIILL